MTFAHRLKSARRSCALSQADLAQAVGVSRVAISQWESGATFPGFERLRTVASILRLDLSDLLAEQHHRPEVLPPSGMETPREKQSSPLDVSPAGSSPASTPPQLPPNAENRPVSASFFGMERNLPVRGIAACSATDGAFQVNTQCVDYVRRPPALIGIEEAYGLYISGDSMEPKYAQGDLILVHPGRPVRPGDFVVLTVQPTPDAEPSSYCKRLIRRHADTITVEQFNPLSQRDFPAHAVISMHKVLEMVDLFSF